MEQVINWVRIELDDQNRIMRYCGECKRFKPATTEYFSLVWVRGDYQKFAAACTDCDNREKARQERRKALAERQETWQRQATRVR